MCALRLGRAVEMGAAACIGAEAAGAWRRAPVREGRAGAAHHVVLKTARRREGREAGARDGE